MKNLYLIKMILIFLVACALGSPSVAVDDNIDTEKTYRIISKNNAIICPNNLSTCDFTESRSDFCFQFIREGADDYRIQPVVRSAKEPSVLNVVNAFWPCGYNRSVSLESSNSTWFLRHRTFHAVKKGDDYYQFINEESKRLLGVNERTGKIEAFRCDYPDYEDSQENNMLFRLEHVAAIIPEPPSLWGHISKGIRATIIDPYRESHPFTGAVVSWVADKVLAPQ